MYVMTIYRSDRLTGQDLAILHICQRYYIFKISVAESPYWAIIFFLWQYQITTFFEVTVTIICVPTWQQLCFRIMFLIVFWMPTSVILVSLRNYDSFYLYFESVFTFLFSFSFSFERFSNLAKCCFVKKDFVFFFSYTVWTIFNFMVLDSCNNPDAN